MSVSGTPVTLTSCWQPLLNLSKIDGRLHIRDIFSADQKRADELVFTGAGITLDISRQRITRPVLAQLVAMLNERNLIAARKALFIGERVNSTENRPALHTALRLPKSESLIVDGVDVVAEVHSELDRMSSLAQRIRNHQWLGATGEPIEYIVNIGIGGSDLGPVMAYEALKSFSQRDLKFHFVSNVDGTDLVEVLNQVVLTKTLFVVASKTFTTQETIMNAQTARAALFAAVGESSPEVTAKHFVALSTAHDEVSDFGITRENTFGFWDWVGGRYSMESAIGLSTMISIGPEAFKEMLSGFHEMDMHFASAPIEENLPMLMGAIGFWNSSLLGINSVAVLPYDQYLSRFPAYLQQLMMESNGKSVTRSGQAVEVQTGPIYWGEPGTNGQHSFYQLIHQGTSQIACDLIVPAKSLNDLPEHHDALVSNAISQARVLAFGRTAEELTDIHSPNELIPHKVMPGNRPTTLITMTELTPRTLGALVALYEHSVFVQGVIWGINSFDQWGVQLGKEVANSILPLLTNDQEILGFDDATKRAINWYRDNR